jgi:hypothetical protein
MAKEDAELDYKPLSLHMQKEAFRRSEPAQRHGYGAARPEVAASTRTSGRRFKSPCQWPHP